MAPEELVDHLSRTATLTAPAAARLVEEVLDYFSETVEAFVRRRHRQLQSSGQTNVEIFRRVTAEISERRFAAPELSERQLRRIVYG
jgi:hypothetical protein